MKEHHCCNEFDFEVVDEHGVFSVVNNDWSLPTDEMLEDDKMII